MSNNNDNGGSNAIMGFLIGVLVVGSIGTAVFFATQNNNNNDESITEALEQSVDAITEPARNSSVNVNVGESLEKAGENMANAVDNAGENMAQATEDASNISFSTETDGGSKVSGDVKF